jgi:hypothetical protein
MAAEINKLITRLGYNLYMSVIIIAEGYADLDLFGELSKENVNSMMRTLSCRTYAVVPGQANVAFPVRAAGHMKLLGYWVREQQRIGGVLVAADYTAPGINLCQRRMGNNKLYSDSRKGDKPTAPEAIKRIASWTKFKNLMTTFEIASRNHRASDLC